MRLLLVDNYDSFTNNVAHYLRRLGSGIAVTLVKNDDFSVFDGMEFAAFDAIVISPGPGRPGVASDLGICARILTEETRPILGICLGHQALASVEGGRVVRAPEPVHGRAWPIRHDGSGIFANLPNPFDAMRYHSLVVADPVPETLRVSARADGVIMGLEHRTKPRWGVQFHPESIGTVGGMQMLRNFVESVGSAGVSSAGRSPDTARLTWRDIGPAVAPERIVEVASLVGKTALLLESAMVKPGLSRFSYVALPIGLGDLTLTYRQSTGTTRVTDEAGTVEMIKGSVFDVLRTLERRVIHVDALPPFDFHGGFVGWFGYELKSDSAGIGPMLDAGHDDAAFRSVHTYAVIDHAKGCTYVAICDAAERPRSSAVLEGVFDAMTDLVRRSVTMRAATSAHRRDARRVEPVVFTPRHDDESYVRLVEACQREIADGESYELCLTNRLTTEAMVEPWDVYRALRRDNPAPYAAYLPIGDVTIVSSSPERFLRIFGDRRIEAKPIKGTIRRGADEREDARLKKTLIGSEKDRAENMMIVDLLRHDLSAVSEVGSVRVPTLNAIESYPAVHQMVSTVEGRLLPGVTTIDAVRACFPGGSMTGAPKRRSMEILERLEGGPRGVYSGAMGWIGYDGQADLSIVIRTAVFHGGALTIGCGGAITILSEPEQELDEMQLKARALMRAVAEAITGEAGNYALAGGRAITPIPAGIEAATPIEAAV